MSQSLYDLFSDLAFQRKLQKRLREGWTYDKIRPMSTRAIFRRLNRLGIAITPEDYQAAAQRYESAQALAEEWYVRYPFRPKKHYDEDFVWMAAVILWPRLVPDRISFEQIDGEMQRGYDLLRGGDEAGGCDAWRQTWEWLKEKVTAERNTLAALDTAFEGMQSVFNWCQDFEMALESAGLDDPHYCRLRLRYCREFLETFADIPWLMRGNFLRAEAETLWRLGDVKAAEVKYKDLIDEMPDWAWGYIRWSDEYWLMVRAGPKDYDQAERILQQALARPDLEERDHVLDRLARLRVERAQARTPKPRRKQSKRRRSRRKRRR